MKLSNSSKLAAAISLALGASGANALDLATTQAIVNTAPVPPALSAPNVLVVAGASAMRGSFITLMNQDVCQAGTFDAYRATPTANQDFRVYSCRVVTTGPNTSVLGANLVGQNIVVYYRSEGGSAWGPYSVAQRAAATGTNTGTNFVGISGLNLGAGSTCAAGSALVALDGVTVPTHDCPLTGSYSLSNDTPVTGLSLLQTELATSDVEPKLFTDTNNPANIPTTRFVNNNAVITSLKALSPTRIFGQVFNIIGNNNAATNASALSDNVTNLTTAEVAGILSGNIVDWCQVAQAQSQPDCIGGVEHPITVVRRESGSGTQVGAAAYFLNVNCGESWTFVTAADNGAIEAGATAVLETTVGTTIDAVGINIHKNPAPTNTKFYTIDGLAPDRYNAAFGDQGNAAGSAVNSVRKYGYAFEATMTRAPTIVSGPVKTALATALISLSQRVNGVPNSVSVFAIPNLAGNIAGTTGTLNQPVSTGTSQGSSCRKPRA